MASPDHAGSCLMLLRKTHFQHNQIIILVGVGGMGPQASQMVCGEMNKKAINIQKRHRKKKARNGKGHVLRCMVTNW